MRVQHALHLGRIDVLAAGDDHVLLAVVDGEMPVDVARADVAGKYQPSRSASAVACASPQYSKNTLGPRTTTSPATAGRHLAAVVVDDVRLAHSPGRPVEPWRRQSPPSACRPRPGTSRSSRRPAAPARRAALNASISRCGTCVEPVVTARRLREIGVAPARMLDQRLDGRGHQHDQRRAIALDRLQRRLRARSARAA